MIYFTGDIHGSPGGIKKFCAKVKPTSEDIIVLLGDVGANYYNDERDDTVKRTLAKLKPTILCVHGNHEIRPWNIEGYQQKEWTGGKVWFQEQYPTLLFAADGEIFTLNGLKYLVIGGAYSVDKFWRLRRGDGWWPDEQPSQETKHVLKDLTQAEIDRFISIVETEGDDYIPVKRLRNVTFNKYLQYASYAFQGAGFDVTGKTPFEQFERYGEDFGGHVLRDLNMDSYSDFLRYFNDEFRMDGHPWGLRRGSSRTRIMLIPKRDEDGWYFIFSGNPNWNVYEMVKMYLALKDCGCPVRFVMGQETIRYLREEDLVGIVPAERICAYCQSSFPGMEVNDFRHLDESCEELQKQIEWLPFDILKLKEIFQDIEPMEIWRGVVGQALTAAVLMMVGWLASGWMI